MPELKIKDVEVARDIPGNPQEKGGPAKVLRFTFENDERQPELFATSRTKVPAVGDTVNDSDLEFSDQWKRWQFKKKEKSGGGFQRSPKDTKAIQRQHSQEMALRREANMIAAGHGPMSDDQLRQTIDWFEGDISGKILAGVEVGPMTSDVPGDLS